MGYSESLKTLEARLPLLENIRKGEGQRWILAEGVRPSDFAYQIREALHAGHANRAVYPEFTNAPDKFRVEIVDRRTVQAVPKPEARVQVVSTGEPIVQTHGLATADRTPSDLMGPQTADSIIQAWLNMQPSNTPMHFPHARMSAEELEKLYKWGMDRTPPWLIFVGIDGQLTLRLRLGNESGLNWEPGDEP